MSDLHKTPLLDELEKGEFPSFVSQMKQMAKKNPMSRDLLGQLEQSYVDKITHWKHGGLVGIQGYGAGVIGRYTNLADKFPALKGGFHTVRLNQVAGWFYTTKSLREVCDIWDKYGSGLLNMHGSTGDFVLLGAPTDNLEDLFTDYLNAGWDLGGSSSDMRTPSCCNGMARCEYACYDTMGACHDITMAYQDELHRPAFPYKFKFKCSACPNDCVASVARADMSIIGTWRDEIQVNQDEVRAAVAGGLDMQEEIISRCPTSCIKWDGNEIDIDDANCVKCMHCINLMPKGLRPGKDRGATILLGSKAPIVEGALLSSVLVPFMKLEPPYTELKDLVERIWDFWGEYGKNRERTGELMQRVGLGNFLEAIEVDPLPQMVSHPRDNPYVFYEEYFEEGDDEEEDEG